MLEGDHLPNLVANPLAVTKDMRKSSTYDRLQKWNEEHQGGTEHRYKIAYSILSELLTYQFAFFVLWIETQDLFFTHFKFERFMEIGPSLTLSSTAARTLKAHSTGPRTTRRRGPPPLRLVATIEDVLIKAVGILAITAVQKLKKQILEASKSIKDVSNGKSTLQNEILGYFGSGKRPEALSSRNSVQSLRRSILAHWESACLASSYA
ncbi:hypothetical protein OF83DRAFT_1215723 [Amylostereum chailletii]|nr:hypothetical protein OF83DRAFT_1215723 [Amylostereum chailletii]